MSLRWGRCLETHWPTDWFITHHANALPGRLPMPGDASEETSLGFQWVPGELLEPVQVHYWERSISQAVFSICFMLLVLEARFHAWLVTCLLLCNHTFIHIVISMHTFVSVVSTWCFYTINMYTCSSLKFHSGVSKRQTWSRGPHRLVPARNRGVRVVSVAAFLVLCLKRT